MLANGRIKAGYCHYCYKKLVPIGTARANGKKAHDDWQGRKYHKKCWRECRDRCEDSESDG